MASVPHLWLIGGTHESAVIAQALAQMPLACVISVTTAAARSLYPPAPNLVIWVGKLDPDQLKTFLPAQRITAILDASHPYAVAISQLAIAAATTYDLPYLRFERPTLATDHINRQLKTQNSKLKTQNSKLKTLPDFTTLLAGNYLNKQRVLLTIGYRFLPLFQPWHDRAQLFARILPSAVALKTALAAGFSSDRLIALRPPVSQELEQALWRQWQISLVVTKASGAAGGEDVKRQAAAALGVELVIIERPAIAYPQQTSDVGVVLKFCQQLLSGANCKPVGAGEIAIE